MTQGSETRRIHSALGGEASTGLDLEVPGRPRVRYEKQSVNYLGLIKVACILAPLTGLPFVVHGLTVSWRSRLSLPRLQ